MCAYQIVVNIIAFNKMIQKPPTIDSSCINAIDIKMLQCVGIP